MSLNLNDNVRLSSNVDSVREKVFVVKKIEEEFATIESELGEFLIKKSLLVYDAENTFVQYFKNNNIISS